MVTVAFSSNDSHAMLLGIALCSIFENKQGDYPIQIFVFDAGISLENKKRLAAVEKKYKFSIKYIVPDPKLFEKIKVRDRSIAAYYRVTIARLLPAELPKVLYLDCDVIIRGDIGELFNIDLEGKTVAAVPDYPQDERLAHLKNISGKAGVYFNSGILLIDLYRWKKNNTEEKLFSFMHENPDKLEFDDQDPLNVIFSEDYKQLPMRYNFMTALARPGHEINPLVAHFSGGAKPWYFLSALRYQSDWVQYANLTPWKYKKYRKVMDIYFAQKYHFYPIAWWAWGVYKKTKQQIYKIIH